MKIFKKFRFISFICLMIISLGIICSCGEEQGGKEEPPVVETQKFTVTFNVNGGSSVAAIEVEDGQKVNKPTDPTRSGYTFEGWYVDQALTTKFDFTKPITANTTLYAKWTEVVQPVLTYSVTYVTEHGTAPAGLTGVTALPTTLPVLEAEGYTFGGWFIDEACTTVATAGAAITENTTLYAKWTEVPSGPTLLSHINELAENVDETPEFEIKEDTTALSYRGRRNSVQPNTTEVDITNPEDNENYKDYILSDRYFWGSEHTKIKNANIYIEYVKSVKEELISSVTMLDTWVYDININCKYRIRYDQVNDVVYLEKISDGNLYIRISSTYVNNKMVIDAYQYQIYDESTGNEVSFHYEEDKILYYYEKADFSLESRNVFMLTSDLSVANPVNVCLSYVTMDQGDSISYQMFKYLYKMGNETESGLDVYNDYFLDGFTNEYHNFSDTVIINNSNDDLVLNFQDNDHSYYFGIDLYELTGYSQIIRGDNHYKIVVGDKTFVSGNSNEHGSNNSIMYETEDYSIMAYVNEYGTCSLIFGVEVYNKELTPSRALNEFLEYLGLSFKDSTVYDKLSLLDNSSEILDQYSYFDYSYSYLISPMEMEKIYDMNKLPSATYSEIMEMLNAEYVSFDEQTEDANYYLLYSNGVSGTVSYNENNTFNLSNLTITLSESGILTTGSEYSLVAYLSDGYDIYLLDKQTITFEGVSVSINLNNNVELPDDLKIGKYRIIVYLSTEIDSKEVRVSSIHTAEAAEFDYINTIEKEGQLYFVRVVSSDGLIVAMDEMFELKGQAEYIEETKYLNLSSISGSLSNGYVLLESDLVTLAATFYNSNNEAVKVIEDKFYFGSSGLSAVVSMEEFPELAEGTYQLKIAFDVVDKDGNIIFSEKYKNEESFKTLIINEQRLDIDALIIEAFEEYIEFKYVKVLTVNLNITYENDIIDISTSGLEILYPEFFENQDTIFLDICFRCDDEEVSPLYFSVFSTYDLLESEFIFPTIDLTNYSVEGGLYKVEYQIIVSGIDGSTKIDKKYETELEFDIEATVTDNVVEETE